MARRHIVNDLVAWDSSVTRNPDKDDYNRRSRASFEEKVNGVGMLVVR